VTDSESVRVDSALICRARAVASVPATDDGSVEA
jgi:hypothetical protein